VALVRYAIETINVFAYLLAMALFKGDKKILRAFSLFNDLSMQAQTSGFACCKSGCDIFRTLISYSVFTSTLVYYLRARLEPT
jgi:hypothetical protein